MAKSADCKCNFIGSTTLRESTGELGHGYFVILSMRWNFKDITMRKGVIAGLLILAGLPVLAQKEPVNLVLPSDAHQQWADAEIGAIFHFDVTNYVPEYNWRNWGTHPPASVFNPGKVNTDQWIQAAKAGGAKYAVLVAKHCAGFSLWPTKAHEYSVKNSPWKGGKGDLVADFIASCNKYGLRPGIYASAAANGYFWVDNPGKVQPGGPVDQKTYNGIVEQQLTELWSNYGKLFEIWFDGGVQSVKEGGPDVAGLLKKLQPDAVVFQGPSTCKNLIRWIGNEHGTAPYPNWSTTKADINPNGTLRQEDLAGSPDGTLWCPGETDFPLRSGWQGGWFWKKDGQGLLTTPQLLENYVTSVGRNSNMLIGVVVDTSGLVPAADVKLLKDFGEVVQQRFSTPVAATAGSGNSLEMSLGTTSKRINAVLIKEDIAKGERIRKFAVEGFVKGKWTVLAQGSSVGHKYIALFDPVTAGKVRLKITSAVAAPVIKEFAVLNTLAK